ncbi:MAG TPA: hypothetical protein VF017_14965 [Thermoanaerobaculia bacterium]|nr:hypothetical protein [Thermoanaerobaculia bacterium]
MAFQRLAMLVASWCLILLAACHSGPPAPAPLDTANDACSFCRMAVSDRHFAVQVVAPGEEPLFFDDLGCLAHYFEGGGRVGEGAVTWVADHRTAAWVRAESATYTEVPGLWTPMRSQLIAHADAASRGADPAAAGGSPRTWAEVLGRKGSP